MSGKTIRAYHLTTVLQSGAGKVIVGLVKDLREHGVECDIVSSGNSAALKDWPNLIEELANEGIGYRTINLFSRENKTFWNSTYNLADYLRERDFDLIHAHAGVPALAAHLALDLVGRKKPVIGTLHGWGIGRPGWMDKADLYAFSRCAAVTAMSTHSADLLARGGIDEKNITVIPCGVDSALLDYKGDRGALAARCGITDDNAPILVNLAVVEPRKNQRSLLEALVLIEYDRKVSLALIGDVKDRAYHQELLSLATGSGIEDRVFFLGHVDDPTPLLAGASVFVFPSLSEGFGIAILEAMALGIPVVATDKEGPADMIYDRETALRINPEDPRSIADAVAIALDDGDLRKKIRLNARRMVSDRFLWPSTVSRIADLYQKTINSIV